MKFDSYGPERTFGLGVNFAARLKGGDTVLLKGELGAGKTVFTKGIAVGLGIEREVLSPTFSLMNVYEGRLCLYHIDAYRLANGPEAEDSGLCDYIGRGDVVTVIEWYENIAEVLRTDNAYIVEINRHGEEREIIINDK